MANRTSQRRPSEATCFLDFSSLRTSDWRVSLSPGAASCRSRIFYMVFAQSSWRVGGPLVVTLMLPAMSVLTGVNATDPRRSV